MSYKEIVLNNVKQTIKKSGFKQCYIAEKCGYSAKRFSDLLNNRKAITVEDIGKLYNGLGISPNELFGFEKAE